MDNDIEGQADSLFAGFRARAEVAFYGGNPLGMEAAALEKIFRCFDPYSDKVLSFRLSARPDPVNENAVRLFKKHNVRTIELGIPTFNERILRILQRGHTSKGAVDTYYALRKEGFEIGIQVMVGLPGETIRDVEQTVSHILALAPSFIRVYPLVVIEDTPLAISWRGGYYSPDTLDRAVAKSAFIYVSSWTSKIKTIKMGLTENEVLRRKIVCGPYHPAFGYLVKSETFGLAVEESSRRMNLYGKVLIRLHSKDVPHLIGYRRKNIERLKQKGLIDRWATDDTMTPGHFTIEVASKDKFSGNLADALPALRRRMAA
jgi:histone acetyltransferase (RNA polymerase elongator complex component)